MRYLFIFLLALTACADKSSQQTSSASDTTDVIKTALRTVLEEPFPDMDGIKRKSNFHDSIFLTTSALPLAYLPTGIDSFQFKIFPDSLVCSAIKSDTATDDLPNYLKLQTFEKTDTGYFLRFESIDCIPAPSRAGSVSLHLLKTKDKFVFKN